jgi:2-keto-4-pentenoate hydratase/2-oxohepta-3-ene-1,7-dioic acid hydratase in catechol pathway
VLDQWRVAADADTRDLIFDVSTIIATISARVTLMSGDLMAAGTPAGVRICFKPPKYVDLGDFMSIEILWIGVLENESASGENERGGTRTD